MRVTLNVDEALVKEARRFTGIQDISALVHEGVKVLVARRRQ